MYYYRLKYQNILVALLSESDTSVATMDCMRYKVTSSIHHHHHPHQMTSTTKLKGFP